MIIAATGHRPNKLIFEYDMTGPMSNWIANEIDMVLDAYKPEMCISGMALGIDMLFAACALYKKIPVAAAIPFEGQEKMWPEKSQDIYNKLLAHKLVTKYYVCEPGYAAYKMQLRNEWMTDRCDLLLAVWDGSAGGTGNCVKYAIREQKEIIYINPKDFLK